MYEDLANPVKRQEVIDTMNLESLVGMNDPQVVGNKRKKFKTCNQPLKREKTKLLNTLKMPLSYSKNSKKDP